MDLGAGASGAASGAAMGSAFGPWGTAGGAILGGGLGLMSGGSEVQDSIAQKQWDATRGYIKGGLVPSWIGGGGQGGQGGGGLDGSNGVGYREVPYVSPWAIPPRYGHEMDNAWTAPQGQGMPPSSGGYQGFNLNDLVKGWGGWSGAEANNAPQAPVQAAPAPVQAAPAPVQAAPAPLPGLTRYANSSKPDWMSERDWRHFDRLASLPRNG